MPMNAIVVILASSFFSHTLQMHQDNAGHWSPALVDAANYVAKAIGKVMCSLQMQQRTHDPFPNCPHRFLFSRGVAKNSFLP
jgi:hypothetical protein